MERSAFSSPEIAQEMQRVYGNKSSLVKIRMRHEKEVKKYVMKIEEAHVKAANSKLAFPWLLSPNETWMNIVSSSQVRLL